MDTGCLSIERLTSNDVDRMRELNGLFARCFDDAETYLASAPDDDYLAKLLSKEHVIALVAVADNGVVGGLVAYELDKFEQKRREIYIYDLAVDEAHRRQGIATGLINEVRKIARSRDVWVVYVQADQGDEPPITLYTKLGRREDVLHFDIDPSGQQDQ